MEEMYVEIDKINNARTEDKTKFLGGDLGE